ncbi:histidine kinase-group VI protein [Tricladium varicosporioides]|nr:histidine kinase-group VI protein [Hymenoscyphus varicosporioides]
MRIGIREQLIVTFFAVALVPLMVLAVTTWANNHNFVVGVTSQQLSLTASLKAAQIASDLLLIQSTCATITTRIILQNALKNFYKGAANWTSANSDMNSALVSGGLSALLQVTVFSRNSTGDSTGLLKITTNTSGILLPTTFPNGTNVPLGDPTFGYPPALYPNITYTPSPGTPDVMDPSVDATTVTAFFDFPLNQSNILLLGPLQINNSYALLSMTLPIVENNRPSNILGFMTVVASASTLIDVTTSREGLANTGMTLLIGPSRRENQFRAEQKPATATSDPVDSAIGAATVKYIFPPVTDNGVDRHSAYIANLTKYGSSNFSMRSYPAAVEGLGNYNQGINNAGSLLSTRNENNVSVSVGYARPQSSLVEWLLIVEQSHAEAWEPVNKLRKIVLACVFGTVGLIILVVLPMAHFSVRPIRRLRDATEKSITPPGYTPNGSIHSERLDDEMSDLDPENPGSPSTRSKRGLFIRLKQLTGRGKQKSKLERVEDDRRRGFKIPAKVQDRKHFITDELTELTTTFNSMSDELILQYQSLEEKVAERTRELEISKKAAEAANESKTLFIANISHELKTPLNGILGMCAVCLAEDDLPRIKRSLQVVYKSGDLLLHLLNDLLTFSKNQIGQQLSLEEREFRLSDIKVQILTIFMKQVQEKNIDFGVRFIGTDSDPSIPNDKALPALGPQGTGRLKDMCLWGDQHRILQVIINLVSNSLKFTPVGGKVDVRIKCLGEAEMPSDNSRKNSMGSRNSSNKPSRGRNGTGSQNSQTGRKPSTPASKASGAATAGTALLINPMDPSATPRVQIRERSPTPPPSNARVLNFLIEVEDTGPGIPESLQDRVFEPFVQGDLGLSKKYGGTGLGLSICSQLARLMGGTITLTSSQTPPTGTTFRVEIPLKHTKSRAASTSSSDVHGSRPTSLYNNGQPDGAQPPSTRPPEDSKSGGDFEKDPQPRLVGLSQPFFASTGSSVPNGKKSVTKENAPTNKEPAKKLRVLVAEDNLVNQEIVIRMLKLERIYDVEVVVAEDGKQAYDIVKESMEKGEFFNLIFMDIQMPNLDGLQSTRLIRQMGYSAPIVALTAFSEESNVKECYDSGMDHFLSKPIKRPALKQVLKRFTTIPEENETSSLTGKRTPPEGSQLSVPVTANQPDPSVVPLTNGTTSP